MTSAPVGLESKAVAVTGDRPVDEAVIGAAVDEAGYELKGLSIYAAPSGPR
ncbi:hypothetical protein AB0G15_32340 [Streptosporangium sp. NPDC023825]|uniref:hypothetical protein n=1 Tax=Streptosporangium sp. NPDC023825 TaxID=3154909 RepID=UPI003447AD1B